MPGFGADRLQALYRAAVPEAVRSPLWHLRDGVRRGATQINAALHRTPGNYPDATAVSEANAGTIDHVRTTGARVIAEVGIYKGHTSLEIARHLGGQGELHLFDFRQRVDEVMQALATEGFVNVTGFGCDSTVALDSYNWPLMRLIEQHQEPIYDYVFLDGAHTWAIDALAFLLIDRLLKPGGYVDFDDHVWTLAGSPSLNPKRFPRIRKLYTDEQIAAQQVQLIIDLLVRRDPRYREIVANKVFQKVSATPS